MSSTDRLGVLRERNKDLLTQLRRQSERLQGVSRSRNSKERGGEEKERGEAEELFSLTDGHCGSARAALARPSVSCADPHERQTDDRCIISVPSSTSKHSRETADRTVASDLSTHSRRHTRLDQDRQQKEVGSRVTFQSNEWEETPAPDRHHLQPLLGYDWIAGVLDVESSVIERSEEFFSDLHTFRLLNKDECVYSQQTGFSEENHSVPPLLADKDRPEANMDTHQCTFSYRINSRLFPVPLHSQECCPVCKKPKSTHPHTAAEPAFIRVSIPRTTLLPAYKYQPHRRCSFDPSNTLGLPSHCLSGWSNTCQSSPSQPSSLDLRSSLSRKTCTGLPLAQPQDKEQTDFFVSRVPGNPLSGQTLNVSRLPRYHFQHFSPRRKLENTSR
ncbi:migration and invasion inhibitory protein [Myripristis murdjan]|uniref:Migration and invasion inhibitory protein n=1 Tax=Myripristis murdjan TaxID=586833 RepID=A0A667WVU8_9TELE|nr:migration and invasion-inhibitory protein [Myripristis murdjan]